MPPRPPKILALSNFPYMCSCAADVVEILYLCESQYLLVQYLHAILFVTFAVYEIRAFNTDSLLLKFKIHGKILAAEFVLRCPQDGVLGSSGVSKGIVAIRGGNAETV